jgi:hypothetical protein
MKIGLGIGLINKSTTGSVTIPPTISSATISGTSVVGQVLTATASGVTGTPAPTLSYQWKRGAANIGTNANTYTLVSADAGQSITCVVTATNAGGSANATSNSLSILSTVLDVYPTASAAYSLRLLRGAFYTSNAIRVRRSSDNTEQDIGFTTSGNLNTTALTSFVGAGNGFIVTWYDQSGNAANATQATQANQPQIVSSGSVLLQGANPTILFNGTSNFMDAAGVTTGNPKSIFVSTKNNYIGTLEKVLFDSVNTNQALLYKDPTNLIGIGFGTFITTTYTATTNFILYSVLHNSTTSNAYVNSANQIITNQNLGTNAFAGLRIGAVRGAASLYYSGNISEFIVYGSNQAANRIAIETNINNYYSVYPVVSDPDAQAFVSAAELTSQTQANAVNTLVIGMKAQGLWTKMKAIYPMVGGTASTHKFNLKNPLDTNAAFRLTFSGTWVHSNTGALPNGTNAFANTFLSPATSLTSSLGLSYYSRTNANTALDQVDIGAITSLNYFYLTTQYNASGLVNRFFGRCTSSSVAVNTANADARGYYYLGKTGDGANLLKSFKNGVVQDTQTGAGVNPNSTVYVGAANNSGATAFYTNRECAFATISDGLTDAEATNCYTLVQQFQTALGRQII